MTDESGLDLVGIGKLAKAVPAKAWTQLVDTACKTFRELLAPVTSTTSGVGRLIDAKFDRLVDAEKVLATETLKRAQSKVQASGKSPTGTIKAKVIVATVEASGQETDPVLRELWANLLAQEIMHGTVHPEFPRILARLSAEDAQLLAQIADSEKNKSVALKKALVNLAANFTILGVSLNLREVGGRTTFIHEHLAELNLITYAATQWSLTATGKAFIESVSDAL